MGTWVRERRLARGLTQEQLAHEIGEYRQNVQAVERGRKSFRSPALLLALAEALDVPFSHAAARAFDLPVPAHPGQNLAGYYRQIGILQWAQQRVQTIHGAALELVASPGMTEREHRLALQITEVVEDLGVALAIEWHHERSARTGND